MVWFKSDRTITEGPTMKEPENEEVNRHLQNIVDNHDPDRLTLKGTPLPVNTAIDNKNHLELFKAYAQRYANLYIAEQELQGNIDKALDNLRDAEHEVHNRRAKLEAAKQAVTNAAEQIRAAEVLIIESLGYMRPIKRK